MRSHENARFDSDDNVAGFRAGSITLMQIIKRIGVILIWCAGMAFVFAAAIVAGYSLAQNSAASFEVASVKPSTSENHKSQLPSARGGRL